MKNHNINTIAIIAAIAAMSIASMALAQTSVIDKYGETLFEGRPFITNGIILSGSIYNSYDLGGSPLGLLDIWPVRFSVGSGYRYTGFGDGAGSYLSGQSILVGIPRRAFLQGFYGPDFLSHKNSGNAVSLPLQRFGLTVAAQTASKMFRSSLVADGYYGKQEWESGDSTRVLMGFKRLRLDIGSQPHSLFRAGLFFGVTGGIDTLYTPSVPSVARIGRLAQTNLPEFGANLNFGGFKGDTLSLWRSNLSFSYTLGRLAYTSKGAPWVIANTPVNGNADAVVSDSFDIFWMTRTWISHGYLLLFTPGLLLGFTGNYGEMRAPNPENDISMLGDTRPSSPYSLNSFWFGIAGGWEIFFTLQMYAEYTLASMSLEYGANPPVSKSQTLHHASFGISVNHIPVELWSLALHLSPRIAYFVAGSSAMAGVSRLGLDPLNYSSGTSKGYQYSPENFLDGFARVSGFTIGVDARSDMPAQGAQEQELRGLVASFWTTFLSSSVKSEKGGVEVGAKVIFYMAGQRDRR